MDKEKQQKNGQNGISLDHVHMKVGDLERSIEFYVSLGATLEARYQFEGIDTAALLIGDVRLNITGGCEAGTAVVDHIGIAINDMDGRYDGLEEKGAKLLRGPKDWEPHKIIKPSDRVPLRGRFAFIEGPDGEFIELVTPRA